MSKVGLIFCAYGTKDYVPQSLAPWLDIRAKWCLPPDFTPPELKIAAVNVRFAGFEGEDDGTRALLRGALARGEIDHLVDSPDHIPETTARGMALQWLKRQGCDLIIMWDSDEQADVASIQRALAFINANPFAAWFRFSYRNLVFTPDQWLAEPFTPPRAFRVWSGGYEAHSFTADNDIGYVDPHEGPILHQSRFSSVTIPASIFNPAHHTWLSDTPANKARSRAKIRYQLEARGWPQCSFAWDEVNDTLIFNPALPTPKVIRA